MMSYNVNKHQHHLLKKHGVRMHCKVPARPWYDLLFGRCCPPQSSTSTKPLEELRGTPIPSCGSRSSRDPNASLPTQGKRQAQLKAGGVMVAG
jgi:hypothetical protein